MQRYFEAVRGEAAEKHSHGMAGSRLGNVVSSRHMGKRSLLNPQEKNTESWLSLKQTGFDAVIGAWSELAVALNSINRSMGLPDLYPFVLSAAVIAKIRFIYDVIGGSAETGRESAAA